MREGQPLTQQIHLPKGTKCWPFDFAQGKQAQVTLEFIFSMIILVLLVFGTFMIFRWAGLDLAERRYSHERILTQDLPNETRDSILRQLDPFFHRPLKMNAVMGQLGQR